MSTTLLGWVLILLGIIAILSGITGGIMKMIRDLRENVNKGMIEFDVATSFINALTELLNALIKAPIWLALTIIGFILVAWGGSLLG